MNVVGVDVGGTKVAVGLLQDGGQEPVLVRPTELDSQVKLLDQIVAMVREVSHDSPNAVGIGVPSAVDFNTGRANASVRIPLADVPLRHVLTERLGSPVFVDNDANVAAFAEAHDENLKLVSRNLVMITLGTGFGGGLVLGGSVYRGSTGTAGELGHMLVCVDLCDGVPAATPIFPQPAAIESVAAGPALDELARQAGFDGGAAIVAVARHGEAHALAVVRSWARRVGIGVANAINIFDPDEVVLGGGAAAAGDLLLEAASQVARSYTLPGAGRQTVIRLARHSAYAGVLGAALLAAAELRSEQQIADQHSEAPAAFAKPTAETVPTAAAASAAAGGERELL